MSLCFGLILINVHKITSCQMPSRIRHAVTMTPHTYVLNSVSFMIVCLLNPVYSCWLQILCRYIMNYHKTSNRSWVSNISRVSHTGWESRSVVLVEAGSLNTSQVCRESHLNSYSTSMVFIVSNTTTSLWQVGCTVLTVLTVLIEAGSLINLASNTGHGSDKPPVQL